MKKNKKKIILIEDDMAIIDVYKVAMGNTDIDMEVISWGKEAIEKIKEMQEGKREKPSLVLLDLFLPDIDGREILKEIKENDKTKDITVFILSNYTNVKKEQPEEYETSADKVILKAEITPTQLVTLIEKQLK
jgi:CheY-like chemotaxis protein